MNEEKDDTDLRRLIDALWNWTNNDMNRDMAGLGWGVDDM